MVDARALVAVFQLERVPVGEEPAHRRRVRGDHGHEAERGGRLWGGGVGDVKAGEGGEGRGVGGADEDLVLVSFVQTLRYRCSGEEGEW